MCHGITLVVLLPVMKLAYEENSHVAVFKHDEGVFIILYGEVELLRRLPFLSRPSLSRNRSSL